MVLALGTRLMLAAPRGRCRPASPADRMGEMSSPVTCLVAPDYTTTDLTEDNDLPEWRCASCARRMLADAQIGGRTSQSVPLA